jgi:pimeloyl-ACP methyl ester carboxylesterase
VVLLHGIGSSRRAFAPVLDILKRDYEVVALDLPGHGDSPPVGDATVPSFAATVRQWLDDAGFGGVHLVGNSLGGWIALELARTTAVQSVVGLAPAGMWTPRELSYSKTLLQVLRQTTSAISPYADTLTRFVPLRAVLFSAVTARPQRLEPTHAAQAMRDLAACSVFEPLLARMQQDRPEGLEQIGCPVCIAWGTQDRILPPRQAKRFDHAIPTARVVSLKGVGHVPMSDNPQLVADTITTHISGRKDR